MGEAQPKNTPARSSAAAVAEQPATSNVAGGRLPAPTALHRIHATPSPRGNRVDIGAVAWRGEGAVWEEKSAQARRIAVCWNVLEGWPTDALESGALRTVDELTRRLLARLKHEALSDSALDLLDELDTALLRRDEVQDAAHGRLHDCPECLARPR